MIAERTTKSDSLKKYRNRNTTSVKKVPEFIVYKSSHLELYGQIPIKVKTPLRAKVYFFSQKKVENNKFALKLYFNETLKSSMNGKLEELKSMSDNWDGENSPALNTKLVDFAKLVSAKLIDEGKIISFCYPLKNGGIQLESSEDDANFEIEINPDQSVIELIYDNEFNLISNNQVDLVID